MASMIGAVLLGIALIALGAINMRGNLSSIHWYHRRRISDADRKPFGRMVGLGTLSIGAGMILFSGLNLLAEQFGCETLFAVGKITLIALICIGLGMSFYAMLKYNGGIF